MKLSVENDWISICFSTSMICGPYDVVSFNDAFACCSTKYATFGLTTCFQSWYALTSMDVTPVISLSTSIAFSGTALFFIYTSKYIIQFLFFLSPLCLVVYFVLSYLKISGAYVAQQAPSSMPFAG